MGGRAKVIVAAAALLANVGATSAFTPLLLGFGALVLIGRAGVPLGKVLRRLAAPLYIALVAFTVQLFLVGETALFEVGPLLATREGMARGILLASKVFGGTSVVVALSLTTPVVELMVIAAWLRVPPILIEVAGLTYRYLFLLAEEAERIREAQTVRLGYVGWRRSLSSYSQMAGLVLLNAYSRAERVYEAMLLRGYDGPPQRQITPLSGREVIACGPLALGIGAIFLIGRLV
jgi:cobalt/nickel transport system permease protein